MQKKKLQKSLQDYLPKIKNPSLHNPFPYKNWILSGCKHPKTRSFAIDRNVNYEKDVVNDDGGASAQTDIDKFLFENLKSLYLKDNCDDIGEISRRGAQKGQSKGECHTFNDVVLFDSPRLIYPPLNLRESKRFFIARGSSGSLMEEARSSLTASEDVSSSSTLLTTNRVATTVTSSLDPAPEDKSPQVEGGVKLPEDCIAVIKKTQCPYRDFKRSMQDMVESRLDGAVEWEFMEELLFCYLDLNERESHKYILSAFVDIVVTLRRRDSDNRITSRSRDVRSNSNNNRRFGRSTMKRSGTFHVDVQHADTTDLPGPAMISTYVIGPFQCKAERAKVKVKARLDLHGIVSVESATLLEEEEVEVPVSKEGGSKMETDSGDAPFSSDADVSMQDAKGTAYGGADPSNVENGPDSVDKPVQMETETKLWAESPKKKVKKTNVPVNELVYGGLSKGDLQAAVEKEFEMALQDRVMEETKDKKNAVEAYVYYMRNKCREFVSDSEREQFTSRLQEVEDWLYEDGEDETKGVYVAKLEELKKHGDPIEERYKEHMDRGAVTDQLMYCINSYRDAAVSNNPKFDHIDLADKQQVLNECMEAKAWLREKKQQQESFPKYATPLLLLSDIKKKAESVDKLCRPIMTKPKPTKQ